MAITCSGGGGGRCCCTPHPNDVTCNQMNSSRPDTFNNMMLLREPNMIKKFLTSPRSITSSSIHIACLLSCHLFHFLLRKSKPEGEISKTVSDVNLARFRRGSNTMWVLPGCYVQRRLVDSYRRFGITYQSRDLRIVPKRRQPTTNLRCA